MPLMEAKRTTKNHILFYLKYHPDWISSGELQLQAPYWRTTGATISRRARELYEEGKIERRIGRFKSVEYRYRNV